MEGRSTVNNINFHDPSRFTLIIMMHSHFFFFFFFFFFSTMASLAPHSSFSYSSTTPPGIQCNAIFITATIAFPIKLH